LNLKQTTTRTWTRFRLPGSAPETSDAEDTAAPSAYASGPPESTPGTFIESGARFEGTLKLEGNFRIDNEFQGELTTDGTVVIGASGSVEGNIQARQIEIEGAVVGNVTARRMCILRASGRLHGNVETACLEIERRAFFQGETKMTSPLAEHALATPEVAIDPPAYNGAEGTPPPNGN